jgi:hypothetical protein
LHLCNGKCKENECCYQTVFGNECGSCKGENLL